MDDQTRRIRRDASGDKTEYLGPTQKAPRQYMPDEANQTAYIGTYSEGYGYNDPQPYDEPYRPERYDRRDQYDQPVAPGQKQKGGAAIAMALLAFLLGAAAIVLFFLWRGAEGRANQPPPAPVTLTETKTVTTSKEGFLDGLFNRDGDNGDEPQAPDLEDLPTNIPRELPDSLPTSIPQEYQDQAEDLINELENLLNNIN